MRNEHEGPGPVDGTEPGAVSGRPANEDADEPSDSLWLKAFRDILERDDIDSDSDFFQVGGYSLLVPQLMSHYESLSGWRPPTRMIFEFSSPAELEAATNTRRPTDRPQTTFTAT